MAKKNHLPDIFAALQREEITPNANQFLFLLGTETSFQSKPTANVLIAVEQDASETSPSEATLAARAYERGETLSYAAQAIVTLLREEANEEIAAPLSYSSTSVDLLRGPDRMGMEVGDRIAQGVFLSLLGVAHGKQTLQIIGHSRGAVESILIIHELNRIKLALTDTPNKSLYDILTETPCSYTKTAMIKFFKASAQHASDNQENRKKLLERLKLLQINAFLLDPVPGDAPMVTWHDPRYYKPIPCARCELLLCRDERSAFFYPIVPPGIEATIIPGHHGTLNGNVYTQQYQVGAQKTKTAQDLVLCKLFHFLNIATRKHGHPFKHQEDLTLNLQHPELDTVLQEFLKSDRQNRKELLINYYMAIYRDDTYYRFYRKTNYKHLQVVSTTSGSRFIHSLSKDTYQGLDQIEPDVIANFVNRDNARLYLKYHVLTKWKSSKFNHIIRNIQKTLQLMIGQMQHPDDDQGLVEMVTNESLQNLFFVSFTTFITDISQKYLRNQLTLSQKEQLMKTLGGIFSLLNTAIDENTLPTHYINIINTCRKTLTGGVNDTLEVYQRLLLQQSNEIDTRINQFLSLKFDVLFQTFLEDAANDPTEGLPALLADLRGCNPNDPHAIESTFATLRECLFAEMSEKDEESTITKRNALLNGLFGERYNGLNTYFELKDTASYLKEIEQQYLTIHDLLYVHGTLKPLVPGLTSNIQAHQLNNEYAGLIFLAGRLLHEKEFPLDTCPMNIDPQFFGLVKQSAISLGAMSPEIQDLTTQLADAATEIRVLTFRVSELQQQAIHFNEENEAAIHALQSQILELSQQKSSLEAQIMEAQSQLDAANERLQQQETLLEERQTHITTLSGEIESLTQNKNEQDEQIRILDERLNTQSTPEEINHAYVIQNQLLPLTQRYEAHLRAEAQQKHPQNFSKMDDEPLASPNGLNWEGRKNEKAMYIKLHAKWSIVNALKEHLTDTTQLPTARLTAFKQLLTQHNTRLSQHRHDDWLHYAARCLAILGTCLIAATGVGAVGLIVYASVTNKSLFFQSSGKTYADACQRTFRTHL